MKTLRTILGLAAAVTTAAIGMPVSAAALPYAGTVVLGVCVSADNPAPCHDTEAVSQPGLTYDHYLPAYVTEGKTHLTIAIGCTGGRHRSLTVADRIASHLTDHEDVSLRIVNRDVELD